MGVNIAIKRNRARLVPIKQYVWGRKGELTGRTYWVDPDKLKAKKQDNPKQEHPAKVLAQRLLYILRETRSAQGQTPKSKFIDSRIGTKREYRVIFTSQKSKSETAFTG